MNILLKQTLIVGITLYSSSTLTYNIRYFINNGSHSRQFAINGKIDEYDIYNLNDTIMMFAKEYSSTIPGYSKARIDKYAETKDELIVYAPGAAETSHWHITADDATGKVTAYQIDGLTRYFTLQPGYGKESRPMTIEIIAGGDIKIY